MSKRSSRKPVVKAEVAVVETPAVEVAPVEVAPVETPAPAPQTSGFITYYVAGKPPSHKNTDSEAHKRQGDVAILQALLAAIHANPAKYITMDEAYKIIVGINPKNKAFLRYASKSRGWLVQHSTEFTPLPVAEVA
jgi:hypothetical protein